MASHLCRPPSCCLFKNFTLRCEACSAKVPQNERLYTAIWAAGAFKFHSTRPGVLSVSPYPYPAGFGARSSSPTMFDLGGLSELLGYTSIACWLGAQFP